MKEKSVKSLLRKYGEYVLIKLVKSPPILFYIAVYQYVNKLLTIDNYSMFREALLIILCMYRFGIFINDVIRF